VGRYTRAMKPVLLVRNDEYESFGVAPSSLSAAGVDIRTVNMTEPGARLPGLADVSAVVTFGGTVNVDQVDRYSYLRSVREFTREAVDEGVPYLGICLGAQILARALGGDVFKASQKEFGFEALSLTPDAKDDPLLSLYVAGDMVFQWHEDTFELPEKATLLASDEGVPNQAFRIGERAWGVQFHQELDGPELAWWLDIADAALDLALVWGKTSGAIRDQAVRHMAGHEDRGRELFRRFALVVREANG
jgi:GMP synthase (glutamine-hydrolysing)